MNIFDDFQGRVGRAVSALAARGALQGAPAIERIVVEPPRDPTHGDLATNAAMVLAKDAKTAPRALADLIAAELRADPDVVAVEVAGPGFINLSLAPVVFHRALSAVLSEGSGFGRSNRGAGQKVNVEYVSANPTGPMHIGHGRGACFGDALAALLAFTGHDVTREYYINDAGAQVDVLGRSTLLRYREALGEDIGAIPEGLYPGDYLKPVGRMLAEKHGRALNQMPEAEAMPIARDAAIEAMMAMIRDDLAALGVRHAVFFSERSLSRGARDEIAAVLEDFRARDLVYQGRLPPPKGAPDKDWEDREQTLFRATRFGDDVDRPLLKSDGGYTYFAADIAYHRSKFLRGFRTMIDVWGADHGGYVKRMKAAVTAVSDGAAELDVKLCQLVRVVRDGVPVKMSKRSGEFVALADVVEEVGVDPVRFMMLFRKNDATLDFDLVKVLEQSKENPVFYVQYAHARCCSVFKQAAEVFGAAPDARALAGADLSILSDPAEMEVIRKLAEFPRVVDQAAVAHEPHRVAFYVHDLASLFHQLWNRGKDAPHLRFVNQNDRKSSEARLALVEAVKTVVGTGLGLLGVSAPTEMR